MYIHDLNCGWMDHPFMTNSLLVENEQQVRKVIEHGIKELYIDTSKGTDVEDSPTEADVKAEIEREMVGLAQQEPLQNTSSLGEELRRAQKVHSEANQIVHGILNDARLGKQVELEKVEPLVEKVTESILRNNDALLNLCRIKNKDDYTFQHSVSVGALLISFARAMELDRATIHLIGIGGMLHDIGKMRVKNAVLNKPGKLTDPEFSHMKSHVVYSREILEQTPNISPISIDVAAQHHERYDGSGYPLGLKGEQISLFGQMAAIVDVYDAITSDRVYHKGMSPTEALRKIFEWSKFHFNHQLAQAFARSIGIYPTGTLVRLESGLLAIVISQHEKNLLTPLVRAVYNTRHNHFISPRDIDLAKPLGQGGGDRIVGHEPAEKWRIEIQKFL
jgi:putative nucleotidyltransferase with HDIG domain